MASPKAKNPDKIPPRKKPAAKEPEIGKRFWDDKPTKQNPLG